MQQLENTTEITQKNQLHAFAKALLQHYPRGVFYLHGNLGAGKTTFTQSALQHLGYAGVVQSPTYSIINEYLLSDNSLIIHADLYRLSEPDELIYLDVREWASRARYVFIEWSERGIGLLPPATAELYFSLNKQERTVTIKAL